MDERLNMLMKAQAVVIENNAPMTGSSFFHSVLVV